MKPLRFSAVLHTLICLLTVLLLSGCLESTSNNSAGDSDNGSNVTAPSALSYSSTSSCFSKNEAATSLTASVTGKNVSYSISPALPAGLSLDTTTGTISGTPTVGTELITYTVTATNESGSTTAEIKIKVAGELTWTWVSGPNTDQGGGVYGTKGIADANNVPGARKDFSSFMDHQNNFYLFGGDGFDSASEEGLLNDLWKFDGINWTWVSGSDINNQNGSYGSIGVAAPSNAPPARIASNRWTGKDGIIWVFGGYAVDGIVSDLWKFDGANWTWIDGPSTTNEAAVFGTKGTPDSANTPGARFNSITWTDSSGDLWLFGGTDFNSKRRNDIWKYTISTGNWTWMYGSSSLAQAGIYGTKGVPDASNLPGARMAGAGWQDSSGNIWIFGGYAKSENGTEGNSNDLWKFDVNDETWTWVSGGNTVVQAGTYGTQGVPASSNSPGARVVSCYWKDSQGHFWIYGGSGKGSSGSGDLSDLWKFDGTNWTWIVGSDTPAEAPIYGTLGVASNSDTPGARRSVNCHVDSFENLWVFGGAISVVDSDDSLHSDLWKFQY